MCVLEESINQKNLIFGSVTLQLLGSSEGTRKFLQSEQLKKFIENNKQIEFNFYVKKNQHPYIESQYINGYRKDIPLRNIKDEVEIIQKLTHLRNTDGAKPLPHAGKRVYTTKPSIQGGWKDNMWDQYPTHEMERFEWFQEPEFHEKIVPVERASTQDKRKPDLNHMLLRNKKQYYQSYFQRDQ